MPLKRGNLKKLISLSAVGAGAIAVTADRAEAGTVTWVGLPTPVTVGFGGTDVRHATFTFKAFSNTFSFGFSRHRGTSVPGYAFYRSISAWASFVNAPVASTNIRWATKLLPFPKTSTSHPVLKIFNAGDAWAGTRSSSHSTFLPVGARFWAGSGSSTTHFVFGNSTFGAKYALFQFGPAATPAYGWVALGFRMADGFGPTCALASCGDPNQLGPELTVYGYAYDTSGNPLPAGAGTPEPGTFAATGLAALVLGAAGMRGWRRKRVA